ncbi:MAG: citrate synthase/methylcitrate synthase [Mesorhizobium sp.]|nr:citrate synthase/methylcitrate synthase [Mesorhizobium sp.]MCO5162972.1 citrate synthase/methylcitrate synthase [Mesorhizobium sp.]
MTIHSNSPAGLDGVAAAVTALSHVDGEKGELVVAGSRIGHLADRTDFEGLVAQLWAAATGRPADAEQARQQLARGRAAVFERLPAILPSTAGLPMVDAFRVAVAAIAPIDGLASEAAIVGAMPVFAAALVRQAESKAPVAPDPALGHAADLLRMMRGEAASVEEAKALDAYLVTVADHGMNASTFAARVVASTQANLYMAVTAGYCALTGPLHGGAPEPVLDMLDAIASTDRIAGWIDEALRRGERLMGFGHRIYKVRDPRADVLKRAVERLGGRGTDLGFAAEVEAYARRALEAAKPDRRLDTNVEFYTAILLDALKIPRHAFTPVFAVGRSAGWTAHALEQQRTGRLLRPSSIYAGRMPERA